MLCKSVLVDESQISVLFEVLQEVWSEGHSFENTNIFVLMAAVYINKKGFANC